MRVSKFKNIYDRVGIGYDLEKALEEIKTGARKHLVKSIRNSSSSEERIALKKKLPAVTFAGKFEGRKKLIQASGLACLDIDGLEDAVKAKAALTYCKYIYAIWISPSGNGLKVLVRIPIVRSREEYSHRYKALEKHFDRFEIDKTSDITRLCFESYDPDLYINPGAKIFEGKEDLKPRKHKGFANGATEGDIIERRVRLWQRNNVFDEGGRNRAVFNLCLGLKSDGISKPVAEDLCMQLEEPGFTSQEIKTILKSAYSYEPGS